MAITANEMISFFIHILGVVQTLWAGRLTLINFIVTCAVQGATRLDGARGHKQAWRPYIRNWGLSEAYVLYWRKYLWHCWDFSAPPQPMGAPTLVWRPHSDSAPGNCTSLAPPRCAPGAVSHRFLCCYSNMRKVQINFLTWKWLHDPWHIIQIEIKSKIALKISGYWASLKGKPATLATFQTHALTFFLWITSAPQHEI